MRGSLTLLAVLCLVTKLRAAPGDVDALDLQMVYTGSNMGVHTGLSQLDGKIILTGLFDQLLGASRKNLARVNADGTLDTDFTFPASATTYSTVLQEDGKMLLAGANPRLVRLNANGSLDAAFAPVPNDAVWCVAVQPDGKLVIGGRFTTLQPPNAPAPIPRKYLARLNPDGTLDTGFASHDLNNYVHTVALQPDGRILIGGGFYNLGSPARNGLARLNANGTLEGTVFNRGSERDVYCIALQADGKVVTGSGYNYFHVPYEGLGRVNPDGTLDASFDPRPNQGVVAIALQADGKILIGGGFTSFQPNGGAATITRKHIARLNSDGTFDSFSNASFNTGLGSTGSILGLSLQADGKVLVAGEFRAPRVHFARLLNDPATQTLIVPDSARAVWTRGGAAPEVTAVSFERSLDGGASWSPLGYGMRIGTSANWQLTGLSLNGTGLVRARGRTVGGLFNGGSGLVEQVLTFPMPAYQQWKFSHLGDVNAPDLGDPDRDGLVTLAEYGLNLPPATPSHSPNVSVFTDGSGRRLRMFLQRDPTHNDVTVEVQAGSDLIPGFWDTLARSTFGAPFTGDAEIIGDDATPGVKTVEVRDFVTFDEINRRWMRVKVTH